MNHDDLRALAKAATPGPWRWNDETLVSSPGARGIASGVTLLYATMSECVAAGYDEDAAFIAAASPDVVLGLLDEIERLRAWGDRPLPEDAEIDAAFPTRSGRHDTYAEAMRLVGARYSKGELVALVNWLLIRAEARTATPSADRKE